MACWEDSEGNRYHKQGNEYEQKELLDAIDKVDFIVAHNVKFELAWLARCGYDLASKLVFCTQIGEYVIAGNRLWQFNLNACLKRRGLESKDDLVSYMIKKDVCPSDIPIAWLLKYCKKDVSLCHGLFLDQRNLMQKHGLLPVMYSRCLLTPVLADIEKNGMKLDEVRVNELFQKHKAEYLISQAEMEAFTGGINTNSPAQLRDFLFGTLNFAVPKRYNGKPLLTPSGDPSTDMEALAALKARTNRQKEFLQLQKKLNEVTNLMTKYMSKMQACCEENDGIMLASFNQTSTRSHRLSSSGRKYKMQYQNIQRELKSLYTARNPGWYIGEQDEGGLEFRVAVDLARDEQGFRDIREKHDPHEFSASVLFNDWNESSGAERKALRTAAKAHTFKPLYGGNSGTKRQQEYYTAFKQRYKGIVRLQESWIETCLKQKFMRLVSGLILYFPTTQVTRTGYITNTASICNYPVQNFATAEIVPLGLVCMWHSFRIRNLRSFIVNTVHDSVITEIHPEEVEEVRSIGSYALETFTKEIVKKLYNYDIVVPLEAGLEYGSHWTEEI
jgi:DNA polymerase I-like protein with 3'-5' exonuclease and polymerase domains